MHNPFTCTLQCFGCILYTCVRVNEPWPILHIFDKVQLHMILAHTTLGTFRIYSGTSHNGPSEKRTPTTDTCRVTDWNYHSSNTLATSEKRTLPDSGQRTKSLRRTALQRAFLPLNSEHPEATPLKLQSCASAVRRYVRRYVRAQRQ